jgi:hypothetical protein
MQIVAVPAHILAWYDEAGIRPMPTVSAKPLAVADAEYAHLKLAVCRGLCTFHDQESIPTLRSRSVLDHLEVHAVHS